MRNIRIPTAGSESLPPLSSILYSLSHTAILPQFPKTRYRTLEGLEGLEAFLLRL